MSDVWEFLELAAKKAVKKRDERSFFLGAIGVRQDQKIVTAVNGIPYNEIIKKSHAEFKVSRMMDYGGTIYVCRVRIGDLSLALARPCESCQAVMRARKIRRCFYSISNAEYGCMIFDK